MIIRSCRVVTRLRRAAILLHRRLRRDEGGAIVEFCTVGVLLMVPLVYLVLTVLRVQEAGYAVTTAAREAGRAMAVSAPAPGAESDAFAAALIAAADFRVTLDRNLFQVDCRLCDSSPDAAVSITVEAKVPLPLMPDVFGESMGSIEVATTHVEHLGQFRGAP